MLHITCCFLCVCVCLRLTCPPLSCCWLFAACVPITRHRFCTIIGPIFDHPRVMSLLAFTFPNHFLPFDDVKPVFYRVFCIEFLHFEIFFFFEAPLYPPFFLPERSSRSEISFKRNNTRTTSNDSAIFRRSFPDRNGPKKTRAQFFCYFSFPFSRKQERKKKKKKKRVYKIRLLFHSKQKIK